jgi:hypothetical protein
MRILITLLFLSTAITFAKTNPEKSWKIHRQESGLRIYTSTKYPNTYFTIKETFERMGASKTIKNEKRFKDFVKTRQALFANSGIKNWTATKHKFSEKNKQLRMDIWGSYTDITNQKVNFWEIHIYKSDNKIELLYTMPASASPKLNEKYVTPILNEALKSL